LDGRRKAEGGKGQRKKKREGCESKEQVGYIRI
jgi:hypothetical protein